MPTYEYECKTCSHKFEVFQSISEDALKICPECGKEKEIFSDEFERSHQCNGCGKEIDFTQCKLAGEAGSVTP